MTQTTLALVLISIFTLSQKALAFDPVKLANSISLDAVDSVKKLVDSGEITVDQVIPAQGYSEGTPLVTLAARSASLKVLQYFISQKANLDALTPVKETAVMLASFFNDDIAKDNSGYVRHETAVHMLVEAGASVNNVPNAFTALGYAAYARHDSILQYLLEQGADVNAPAVDGKSQVATPLMMAAMTGTLDASLMLLRAGADAKVVNSNGKTALDLAQKYNHKDQIVFLQCAQNLTHGQSFHEQCEH